ncbi:trichohyalin-like [Leptopilina heterotoma]|uniref:trichohyalin-like n=1 Tax=Leptopilina heterotoma TaxID=63436 RepID=UPI001CA9BD07|nr:trichohyalin-like [Leptopilina heterotoma]
MEYRKLLAQIKGEEEKLKREADRKRVLAEQIERLIEEFDRSEIAQPPPIPTRPEHEATSAPPLRPQQLPRGWVPAGTSGNVAQQMTGAIHRSQQPKIPEAIGINNPSQGREQQIDQRRGPDESWKEFRLRTGVHRPPKYIRDKAKVKYETPAERGRREAREDKEMAQQKAILQETQQRKQREAEEYERAREERRQALIREEKRLEEEKKKQLRQEATSVALDTVEDIWGRTWGQYQNNQSWRLNHLPEITETARRRMWCRRCGQRGHEEKSCPEATE